MAIGTCEYADLGIKPYDQGNGTNVSSLEFPVLDGSQSGITVISARMVPATDGVALRFRPLGGTSGYTTRYGHYVCYANRSTSWNYTTSSNTNLYVTRTTLGNSSAEGCAFTLYVKGFTEHSSAPYGDIMFWIKTWCEDENGDYFTNTSGGRLYQTTTSVDTRMRFYFTSGNVASYSFKCHNLMGD